MVKEISTTLIWFFALETMCMQSFPSRGTYTLRHSHGHWESWLSLLSQQMALLEKITLCFEKKQSWFYKSTYLWFLYLISVSILCLLCSHCIASLIWWLNYFISFWWIFWPLGIFQFVSVTQYLHQTHSFSFQFKPNSTGRLTCEKYVCRVHIWFLLYTCRITHNKPVNIT